MCCKQQHSLMCLRNWESPGDSVVFHMSDELGGRIEAAKADRIEELLLMLNSPADGGRGGGAALSRPEIEQQIERLCKFQRRLDE
jgi:hypothetical protein